MNPTAQSDNTPAPLDRETLEAFVRQQYKLLWLPAFDPGEEILGRADAFDVVFSALVRVLASCESPPYGVYVSVTPYLDTLEVGTPQYFVHIEPEVPSSRGFRSYRDNDPMPAVALAKAWYQWHHSDKKEPSHSEGLPCTCASLMPSDSRDFPVLRLNIASDISSRDGLAQTLAFCLFFMLPTVFWTAPSGVFSVLYPLGVALLLCLIKFVSDMGKGVLASRGHGLSEIFRLDGATCGILFLVAYILFRGA